MRFHAAIQRPRGALRKAPRQGSRDPGLPLQPVRRAGAGERSGDRILLRAELRRDVPDVREGRRERRRRGAALQVSEEGEAGIAGVRSDQMELHQVPRRPRRKGDRALRAEHRAGGDRRRHREAVCRRRDATPSCRCRSRRIRAGARVRRRVRAGGSEQGHLRVVSDAGDGLRSAGGRRRVFEQRQPRDLRSALSIRLPRATVQARPQHRRRNAGDLGRRQDVDDPHQAGHLLRRRSGVQGAAARAHRRRLRLRVEARARSEDAVELAAGVRRTLRRRRCRRLERQGDREIRLRHPDRRHAGDRPPHDPDQAQFRRLRIAVEPHDHRDGRSRPRGDRGVRRRRRLGDGESGGDGSVSAEGMAARAEDRARGESDVSRRALP